MGKQVLMGGTSVNLSTTAAQYVPFWGFGTVATGLRAVPIPTALTIRNLRADVLTAPGAGKSRAVALYKNGIITALTASITDTNTTASNVVNEVTCVAGDYVALLTTPSGTPAASRMLLSLEIETDTASESILFGMFDPEPTVNWYLAVAAGMSTAHSAETERRCGLPLAGTLDAVYLMPSGLTGAAGVGWTVTLRKGGVTIATVDLINKSGVQSVTGLGEAMTIGNLWTYLTTKTAGTPNNVDVGSAILYTPAVSGESFFVSNVVDVWDQNNVDYGPIGSSAINNSGTQGANLVMSGPTSWTLKGLRMEHPVAPGAGKQYTWTVVASGTPTTQDATIAGAAQTVAQDVTNTDTITDGQRLEFRSTPSGAPNVSSRSYPGFVQTVAGGGGNGGGGGGSGLINRLLLGVG